MNHRRSRWTPDTGATGFVWSPWSICPLHVVAFAGTPITFSPSVGVNRDQLSSGKNRVFIRSVRRLPQGIEKVILGRPILVHGRARADLYGKAAPHCAPSDERWIFRVQFILPYRILPAERRPKNNVTLQTPSEDFPEQCCCCRVTLPP